MYAKAGFDDICYGYPLMEHHMERNYEMAKKLDEYHLFITDMTSLDVLMKHNPPPGKKW